jgi:hypothetical protein
MLAKNDSLHIDGQTADRPCLVTINTGPSVTFAKPHFAAELTERKPSWQYVLQTASKKTFSVLKEVLRTGEFVLRLNAL